MSDVRNVVIIGSGPAGFTAGIYAARGNLEPLILEGEGMGVEIPGGQLMLTTDVENYPGFPEGVQGPELMDLLRKQAQRFGAECIQKYATKVDFSKRPFVVEYDEETVQAKAVIICTGASARWLGIEGDFMGRGVSTCATCDGAFYRDQHVVITGGGDSAMEEATFLTKFASRVTVVHRREELRASKIMQDRAKKNDKIDFMWNKIIKEYLGEPSNLTGVLLEDTKSGETAEFACDGVFLAIGHVPNTEVFKGQIDMDDAGYILPKQHTATNVEGVFAGGDVVDTRYRQAVTAAAMGCEAAIDAERWLEAQE
ncbi:thioredoxin-disulfide reductase [candidate division KSB1 bacterium]|nr:thioredoxin-disulfide reductase [candidate division KSB1 bacterium]